MIAMDRGRKLGFVGFGLVILAIAAAREAQPNRVPASAPMGLGRLSELASPSRRILRPTRRGT